CPQCRCWPVPGDGAGGRAATRRLQGQSQRWRAHPPRPDMREQRPEVRAARTRPSHSAGVRRPALRKELASARQRRMKRKVEAKRARPGANGDSLRGASFSLRYVSDVPGVPLHYSKEQQADRATASVKPDITTNEQRIRRAGHLGLGDTESTHTMKVDDPK